MDLLNACVKVKLFWQHNYKSGLLYVKYIINAEARKIVDLLLTCFPASMFAQVSLVLLQDEKS